MAEQGSWYWVDHEGDQSQVMLLICERGPDQWLCSACLSPWSPVYRKKDHWIGPLVQDPGIWRRMMAKVAGYG